MLSCVLRIPISNPTPQSWGHRGVDKLSGLLSEPSTLRNTSCCRTRRRQTHAEAPLNRASPRTRPCVRADPHLYTTATPCANRPLCSQLTALSSRDWGLCPCQPHCCQSHFCSSSSSNHISLTQNSTAPWTPSLGIRLSFTCHH